MALDLGPRRGMDQKLAEQSAERLVLVDAHLLVAEEDHLMRHQRVVQLAHLAVGQRAGEIDAGDFRADGRRDLANLDRLVGHAPMIRLQPAICKSGYRQTSMRGGASSTMATLEMSRQRAPIQPLPCTNSANRANVAACSACVGWARASSQASA